MKFLLLQFRRRNSIDNNFLRTRRTWTVLLKPFLLFRVTGGSSLFFRLLFDFQLIKHNIQLLYFVSDRTDVFIQFLLTHAALFLITGYVLPYFLIQLVRFGPVSIVAHCLRLLQRSMRKRRLGQLLFRSRHSIFKLWLIFLKFIRTELVIFFLRF